MNYSCMLSFRYIKSLMTFSKQIQIVKLSTECLSHLVIVELCPANRKANDWGTFLGANLALEAQIGNTT